MFPILLSNPIHSRVIPLNSGLLRSVLVTVDDYLDSFLTLVSNAGYTDPQTLVVKFRRGLKSNIQDQITTMPFGRPTDTDPEAWYAAAQRINQVWLTNEAFQFMLQSTTMAPTCSAPSQSTSLLTFHLSQSTPLPFYRDLLYLYHPEEYLWT